jgi:hypothetical protein
VEREEKNVGVCPRASATLASTVCSSIVSKVGPALTLFKLF